VRKSPALHATPIRLPSILSRSQDLDRHSATSLIAKGLLLLSAATIHDNVAAQTHRKSFAFSFVAVWRVVGSDSSPWISRYSAGRRLMMTAPVCCEGRGPVGTVPFPESLRTGSVSCEMATASCRVHYGFITPDCECVRAMAAMLLHSFTDFNLYIPANAMALARIAGIAGRARSGVEIAVEGRWERAWE
jgi:hypothetical protein